MKRKLWVIKAEEHFWRESILGFVDGDMRHMWQNILLMVTWDVVTMLQSFDFWNIALSVIKKRLAYDNLLLFEVTNLLKSNYCTQLEPPV